jgi:ubiquinone/menaquinone biosynthesis C-methylase UbiE
MVHMTSTELKQFALHHFTRRKDYYSKLHHEYPFLDIVLRYYNPDSNVVEIGCGAGFFLNRMSSYSSCNLVGVDICKAMIYEAHKDFFEIDLLIGDAEQLPLKSKSVGTVFMRNLLRHLVAETPTLSKKNAIGGLKEVRRICSAESDIFILEQCILSNVTSWFLFWLCLLVAKLNISVRRINLRDKVVVSFLTFRQLTRLLEQVGFKVIVGFYHHPYTGIHLGMNFGDAVIYARCGEE